MSTNNANLTRDRLVRRALKRVGNTEPETSQIAEAVETLNIKIKELDERGKWLWAINNVETSLTLVASTSSYTVATPPTGIASDILDLNTFALYIGSQHVWLSILDKD